MAFSGEVKSGDEPGSVTPEAGDGVEYHYGDLAAEGVDCHRLQPFEGEAASLTQHTYDEELEGFHERLTTVVTGCDTPGYVYAYVPHLDHVSHEAGTASERFQDTVDEICRELSAFVTALDDETASETLLLLTADHGHVDTDPGRNVDLSEREILMANLRRHEDGTPVRTSGSPRNVHLHLQEGTVAETRDALGDLDARLFTREEALDEQLFGDRAPSRRFRRRCGDLVLTHRNLGTWFGDVEPDDLELVGMHGGLHPSEMLVPFGAVRADRLQ